MPNAIGILEFFEWRSQLTVWLMKQNNNKTTKRTKSVVNYLHGPHTVFKISGHSSILNNSQKINTFKKTK